MRRTGLILSIVLVAVSVTAVVNGQTATRSALHDYRVVTVA